MIFKRIFFLCLLCILGGCRDDDHIEKEIIALIEKACVGGGECSIDFNALPLPQWDDLYIFSNVDKQFIQDKIKVPYGLYQDIGVKIIFVSNGKITQYQEIFPVPDTKGMRCKLIFSFSVPDEEGNKSVDYYHLTPGHARMKVVKGEYSNNGADKMIYYQIHPGDKYQIGR